MELGLNDFSSVVILDVELNPGFLYSFLLKRQVKHCKNEVTVTPSLKKMDRIVGENECFS